MKTLPAAIAGHAVMAHPLIKDHVFPSGGFGQGSHADFAEFGRVCPVVHATLSQVPRVVHMLVAAIAGQAVMAHPSVDDQMFPNDRVGHATHALFAAFGCVRPVHAELSQVPIVVKMLLAAIAGHAVMAHPSVDVQVFPRDRVGHATHALFAAFG